jgi:hypothetical protein
MAAETRKKDSIAVQIVMSGGVGATIIAVSNPLDVLRVRWQLLASSSRGIGLVGLAREVVRTEGFMRGLYRPGLGANMLGVFTCTGIRIGIYPTVRDAMLALTAGGERDARTMAAAGLLSGALSFFIATPFFQAKTRLQAEAGQLDRITGLLLTGPRAGHRPAYSGMLDFFRKCAADEGPRALLRGSDALVLRGSLLSMGHLSGYDGAKTWAKAHGVAREGLVLHVAASFVGALLGCTLAAPGDRIMTEYQTAPQRGLHYRNGVHCALEIARKEGPAGFLRGWWPLFLRIAPTFAVFSAAYEASRKLAGLDYF